MSFFCGSPDYGDSYYIFEDPREQPYLDNFYNENNQVPPIQQSDIENSIETSKKQLEELQKTIKIREDYLEEINAKIAKQNTSDYPLKISQKIVETLKKTHKESRLGHCHLCKVALLSKAFPQKTFKVCNSEQSHCVHTACALYHGVKACSAVDNDQICGRHLTSLSLNTSDGELYDYACQLATEKRRIAKDNKNRKARENRVKQKEVMKQLERDIIYKKLKS